MPRLIPSSAILIALISILYIVVSNPRASDYLGRITTSLSTTTTLNPDPSMLKSASQSVMSKPAVLRRATTANIVPHRSSTRGHSDHGWLDTYHSFSFADWHDPRFTRFGALRVLNEDRVRAGAGFPTHPHRDFEIFSYILSGELTHRDSMMAKGGGSNEVESQDDCFSRMQSGDVQFTTGGTGIAHSEANEHPSDTVHFLQIWALPWKRGLTPRYHTRRAGSATPDGEGFVRLVSPLRAGKDATEQQERDAEPAIPGTVPIHADLVMGAAVMAPGTTREWLVGPHAAATEAAVERKVFVHLPMTQGGRASIRIGGKEDVELSEGDGAFVEAVRVGDGLSIESIGSADAEVVVLDTA